MFQDKDYRESFLMDYFIDLASKKIAFCLKFHFLWGRKRTILQIRVKYAVFLIFCIDYDLRCLCMLQILILKN